MSAQAEKPKLNDVSDGDVYRFLYSYYIYQDQLSWNRIQSIAVVELAGIAGAVAKGWPLGVLGLFLATLVVLAVWALMLRDWEVRDALEDTMRCVHERFGIEVIPPAKYWWRRGRRILPALVCGAVAVNIILGSYLGFAPPSAQKSNWDIGIINLGH
ncbi:MAG TPA: hypothetical protein VMF67_02390 [Rhizomicrobium sp.]|nr:hypothetical protein [Rhizomicrobium sp.]